MAKYFITFVLIAFLALENTHIYNRLYAHSHPNGRNEIDGINTLNNVMRLHQNRQYQATTATVQSATSKNHNRHQRHGRKLHRQTKRLKRLGGDAESLDIHRSASRRDILRYKRHMEHQRQHNFDIENKLSHHQAAQHSHHRSKVARFDEKTLKTMPRIWQHLSMVYDDYDEEKVTNQERMYGDDPLRNDKEQNDSMKDNYSDANDDDDDADVGHDEAINRNEELPRNKLDASTQTKDSNDSIKAGCPKCESSRKVERVSEEELTRLRIEFVKQQILEKLRLKERPNIAAVNLPKPIYEGVTIEQDEETLPNKDLDDYYARTSKKFIFLQVERTECNKISSQPSMCFSFKLDDTDADGYDVTTAVLWIFKNHQKHTKYNASGNQTFIVSEVQQQLDSNQLPVVKEIAQQTVDVQDEWMKIDIEWPIKRWFGNHDLSHLIQITCQSCDMESMEHLISVHKDYRPFIMVDTQNRRRQPRQKRNINCTDGVTECCREKLYISFDEIGWGDWIIQPRGYDAYFCRGSCNSVSSVSMSMSQHTSVLQKLLTQRGVRRKHLELVPCCTAKQYSSLQLVFMDSNNTATQKTFPNMVVESCGCR